MSENGVLQDAPLVSVIIPCYNAEKYIDSMAACLILKILSFLFKSSIIKCRENSSFSSKTLH